MISTINFPDFLDPLRKSLISSLPRLGDPWTYVKALFIHVKVDWVSKKIVDPKDGEPWGKKAKSEKRYGRKSSYDKPCEA